MLLIVGAVLKIVLCILLIVLAIALVILAVLLLCGIKYEAIGNFSENNKKATGFASWLFNLVRVDFSYSEAGLEYNLKIPLKSFIFGKRNKKENKVHPPIKEKQDDRVVTAMDSETSRNNSIKKQVADNNKNDKILEPSKKKEKKGKTKKKRKKEKEKTLLAKLKEAYYEYDVKSLYKPLKRFLKRVLKAIGIRKARADLTFGFDDPSLTGMVLGGGCAVAAFLPFDFRLRGHFDGAFLDGNVIIKGKTCAFAILVPTARLVFEKPVWKLIKKL